ncbi:MAG: Negative regulator of mitotic exit [Thelocarpon superellum]|nr:MAG: Negative regulator of mitotic exit [Thelocarpon superellum]
MAFLFGKSKKNQSAVLSQKDGAITGLSGSTSSIPTANGSPAPVRDREKPNRSPTPNSSVNNSLNSLGGNGTPSPENKTMQEKQDLQYQAPRNAPAAPPMVNHPNASLYPWAQRRFTFTTSHPNPFPRYGAAVNSVANKEGDIYLMGGLINGSTVKGDLWLVEAGGGSFSCYPLATTSEGPGPRVGHASLIVGNAFIVYGGDTKMDDRDMLDDTLYLLNTSTRHWSRAIPAGPRPSGRYGHTLNIIGSKIYIFGGQVEGYFFNDLVAFDLNALQKASNKWEMLVLNSNDGGPPPGQIPPARTNHTIVTWEDQLYLFGGTNGLQWFNDVWTYDPATNAWTQLDCIGYIPAPREGHAATLVGDVMYIFGGRTEEANDLGDLAAFRISSRRWYTFQNMGPSPSPRSGHSMTSYGKQIVVLGGEPSSAPRDAAELSLVYVLDTGKIRYPPTEGAGSSAPGNGERGPGIRRPSAGEKTGIPQSRPSRDGLGPAMDSRDSKRLIGPPLDGTPGGPPPFSRGDRESSAFNASSGPGPGPGAGPSSRLPRVSMAQGPPGPPPQQQAPTPRPNGVLPTPPGPRNRTPTRNERPYTSSGLPPESGRAPSLDREHVGSAHRDTSLPREAPVTNGRRTPTQTQTQTPTPTPTQTQTQTKSVMRPRDAGEAPIHPSRDRSRSRQARQQSSVDSTDEPAAPPRGPNGATAPLDRTASSSVAEERKESVVSPPASHGPAPTEVVRELEAAKSKNAWFASELALARKAGFSSTASAHGPSLEERAADSVGEQERPLLEALVALKAELARVQGSIDSQATLAAKQIAEVERQRDVAVSEAVYAKAKLAAHGGSQAGTPQPDSSSRGVNSMDMDRSAELNRRLAAALGAQSELQARLDARQIEVQAEKQARQLAEDTANAAQARLSEVDPHNQRYASEVESLRAELHQAERQARDESARSAEAVSAAKLLRVDRDELQQRLDAVLARTNDHSGTLGSLREAIAASTDKASMLERKLDDERGQREMLERKLRQLRAEHEERTAELDTTTRRLKDAEDLGEAHAAEARTHREAILAGLGNLGEGEVASERRGVSEERLAVLQAQVDTANSMVKKSQQAANAAAEKLRSAEERIAGLEAYQEQASREGLSMRKQLQIAMKDNHALRAEHTEAKRQLANHQREANAITVQHGVLKDLLGERGINVADLRNRGAGSPASGLGTPDQARVRELEQRLDVSLKAQREAESSFELREQEAGRVYREKLEQLEGDYQSAVHYVKGTEKMLKRMKEELARYKSQNSSLQTALEEAQKTAGARSAEAAAAPEWEQERRSLQDEIHTLQDRVKHSVAQLEKELGDVRSDLGVAREQRDLYQSNNDQVQQELARATQQSRLDLEQLKNENAQLEARALDAEQKVSLLLDQVESSVDSYRRQSRQLGGEPNGVTSPQHPQHGQQSSINTDSTYPASNRNSVALDSLASELDALRSHWETTNKNYRLSNTFDFEKTPTSANTDGELSGWTRSWREKLELEEGEKSSAAPLRTTAGRIHDASSTGHQRDAGASTPLARDPTGHDRAPSSESHDHTGSSEATLSPQSQPRSEDGRHNVI